MGEIWVSESGQAGRIWAIRRKRKDFHSLYFSPWNTCAHRLYSTEQTVPARPQRSPNVGRSAARRRVGQDGTNFEAVDGFFRVGGRPDEK